VSRRWFGTDGIRGRAGAEPLTESFLVRLGMALGREVGAGAQVLVGRDTRESGPAIITHLSNGLLGANARVVDLGVIPTPAMPMALRARDAALGIIVSASHNPWPDNGIKLFGRGGVKLPDAREAAIEAIVEQLGERRALQVNGRPERADGAEPYRAEMLARFAGLDLDGLMIAVDCANGATYDTAPAVLEELGAVVTAIADKPNGRNINEGCGSTHLDALRRLVANGDYELGVAFDGDGDRVLMVDADGRVATGDHMLGFLGRAMHEAGALPGDAVVGTVMSNLGLERMLAGNGVRLLRAPVGDRYVHAEMQAAGAVLGGEASGHLILLEDGHYHGDGLHTALRVLEGLVHRRASLASVIDAMPSLPQVLVNVPVRDKPPIESLDALVTMAEEARARHGDDVRVVLRYSGTEDLARVMVEGVDPGLVERLAADLADAWTRAVGAKA